MYQKTLFLLPDMPLTFEADEIAPSHEENLYALLYELQIADRLPEFNDMFNSDVVLDHLVRSNLVTLQPLQCEYEEKFSSKCVEVDGVPCFHLSEFGFKRAPPRKLARSFEKLPEVAFRECGNCPMHPQEHCKLLSYEYGFLCFLHMIPLPESSRSAETGTPWSIESEVSAERDLLKEGGPIDEDQERIEAAQQSFPATSSLDVIDLNVEYSALDTLGNDPQRQGELALPHLPFFSMEDGFDYMLMSDVTHHLSIREDYCLAALAQFCEGDCEFVDSICDKYLLIDTNCQESKYEEGRAVLRRIFNEAKSYERTLPSEEEFRATLHRLGLENMGKGSSVLSTSGGSSSSVPLWTPNMLEDDENQLVCMESVSLIGSNMGSFNLVKSLYSRFCFYLKVYIEADEFLKRASGTRASMSSSSTLTYRKDAALKTYLKYLDPTKVVLPFFVSTNAYNERL